MTVAKLYRWEAAHRLPWHEGGCQHLHGHSYRMWVTVEGEPDARGMLLDFKELKAWLGDLIKAWDHATLVAETDAELLGILDQTNWKRAVLPYDTTAENLCRFVADHLKGVAARWEHAERLQRATVRIAETETCYAELAIDLA